MPRLRTVRWRPWAPNAPPSPPRPPPKGPFAASMAGIAATRELVTGILPSIGRGVPNMTTLKNGRASPADAALKPKDAISNVKSPGMGTGTAQPGLTQDDEAARHHRDAERNGGGESANATTSTPPREGEDGLPAAPSQEAIDALVAHGWTHDQALRALSNPVRATPPSNPAPDESKVGATPDEEAPSAAAERSLDPNVEDESTTKKATTPPKATAPSTKAPPASGDELNLMFDAPPASIEDSPEDAPDAAHSKQTSGDLFGTPEEAEHHPALVDEASAQKGDAIHESTPTTGRGVGNALDGEGIGDGLQQPVAPPPTLQQQDEEAGAATTQPTVAKPDAAGVEGAELDALAEQPTTPAAGEAPVENVDVDPFAVPGVGTRTPPETESTDPSTDPSETDTGDSRGREVHDGRPRPIHRAVLEAHRRSRRREGHDGRGRPAVRDDGHGAGGWRP